MNEWSAAPAVIQVIQAVKRCRSSIELRVGRSDSIEQLTFSKIVLTAGFGSRCITERPLPIKYLIELSELICRFSFQPAGKEVDRVEPPPFASRYFRDSEQSGQCNLR